MANLEIEKIVTKDQYKLIVKKAGKEPINPIGTCFDSTGHQILCVKPPPEVSNMKVCHGLGVANMPGQEGKAIAHAWIEFDHVDNNFRVAMDTTWGEFVSAEVYRKDLKMNYVVEYTPEEFVNMWRKHNYPGPWDYKLVELQKFNRSFNVDVNRKQ